MEQDPNLRSKESIQNAFVLFVNKTQRIVDIYWVDYEGAFVPYMKLEPNRHTIINTFSTHPWIFKDSMTGERMHAEHNEVYWPKPFFVVNLQPNNVATIKRKRIDIHFPLRTLRQNAIWKIVENLENISDIEKLEIPYILRNDLKIIFTEYIKHKNKSIEIS